jgi:microcystin degradation protein MlrC
MRVAVGGYLVAANTFATERMGLETFQRAILSGDSVLRLARGENPIAGFMAAAGKSNWDVVPLHFIFP